MLQMHSSTMLGAVTYHLKKTGSNPFQSFRTRARNLLTRFEETGLVVCYSHDIDIDREQRDYYRSEIIRLNNTIAHLQKQLDASGTTPASRTDRARALFSAGQFKELAAMKRTARVSYATLGFTLFETMEIEKALSRR